MDLHKFGFTSTKTKPKETDDEKAMKKKEYERKRVRNFIPSWKNEFEGLVYEESPDNVSPVSSSKKTCNVGESDTAVENTDEQVSQTNAIMYCGTCRTYENLVDKTCSMFVGTPVFRRDTLVCHWKSQSHLRCTERKKLMTVTNESSSQSVVMQGPIVDMARKMGSDLELKVEKLVNTAYFVCKEEMPFISYPSLIKLQEKNKVDLGNFYRTDNACRRFVTPIYDELYTSYTEELMARNFFSILIDGATDTSVTENELIYVRFLKDGVPENHYLSIEDIQHANADGILECIKNAFSEAKMEDWMEKLVGFGSDGASVNMGKSGGVAAKLQETVNHLVSVHCVSHRLELAATNAIKHNKFMNDLQELLHHVYKQYHYSPKALRELHQIAESLEEKVLKPGNLHGTRWLPHVQGALESMVKNYAVILAHFEHIMTARTGTAEVQGRATKVSRKLKEFPFVYMMFFMLDVLDVLKLLSLKSQKDDITLAKLTDAITFTHLALTELKSENKDNLTDFLGEVNGNGIFRSYQLSNVVDNPDDHFKAKRGEIIDKISEALNQRFKVVETDPVLKSAVTLLELDQYPRDRAACVPYGNMELNLLKEHFNGPLTTAGCDTNSLANEFRDLKAFLLRNRNISPTYLFQTDDLCPRLPNLLMLLAELQIRRVKAYLRINFYKKRIKIIF